MTNGTILLGGGDTTVKTQLQLMRPQPQAIGWYLRAGYNQHQAIGRLLQAKTGPSGVVVHPDIRMGEIQQGLRAQLMERDIEMVISHATSTFEQLSNTKQSLRYNLRPIGARPEASAQAELGVISSDRES